MRIFLDTADLGEIRDACSWRIIDGVTTNPSLIRRAVEARQASELDMERYIEEICRTVPGPVSLEVISLDAETMVEEAMKLHARFNGIRENVVIKIPVNTRAEDSEPSDFEGLKAMAELCRLGIPVNATLVMTAEQALLCAKAGARYVSPFMGRVDDFEATEIDRGDGTGPSSGNDLVSEIVQVFRHDRFECEIIAASIRHLGHVRSAELCGAHIATVPLSVLTRMARHPKTSEGIRRFTNDVVREYSDLFSTLPMPYS